MRSLQNNIMKKILIVINIIYLFGCSSYKQPEIANTKAIDFSLKDINGKTVSLDEFKNKKVVMLVFWATWCPVCKKEIPELKKLQAEFSGKDFEILAIDIQEKEKIVADFVGKNDIKYTVLIDIDGTVSENYKILGIPANIIINKSGNVIYNANSLPKDPKEYIEKLLK